MWPSVGDLVNRAPIVAQIATDVETIIAKLPDASEVSLVMQRTTVEI